MKLKYILFLLLLSYSADFLAVGEDGYMFRLILKDKGHPAYSIDRPQDFLSPKSLERRQRQGIVIDSTDLPIDMIYLNQIKQTGAEIRVVSKWIKTVTVYSPDSSQVESLKALPFVDSLCFVWKGTLPDFESPERDKGILKDETYREEVNVYGEAYEQIHLHKGDLLHNEGFTGEGMTIAVIDGGFLNTDRISAFDQSHILGTKSFSHKIGSDFFNGNMDHGTKVLSCMLSNQSGTMIGTAPQADYFLIFTETSDEEFPVEEDYWVAGIEYADSLGIDVVNTSLGYSTFDLPEMNHTIDQLDGKTVLISRAASMASDKGMLLCVAAGNEGAKPWTKITFPADAEGVITVGSVDSRKVISSFSSVGLTADGRIKPDLMAIGYKTALIGESGVVQHSNGTSFASPVLTGLVACLWQALPQYSSKEIIELIKKNSDRYLMPDSLYGYGIPDVYKAYLNTQTGISPLKKDTRFLYADQQGERLYINLSSREYECCKLYVYSVLGSKVFEKSSLTESVDISMLHKGIYIAYLDVNGKRYVRKFIKM